MTNHTAEMSIGHVCPCHAPADGRGVDGQPG